MDDFGQLLEYFDRQSGPRELEKLGLPPSLTAHATELTRVRWGLVLPPKPHTSEETKHLAALAPLIEHREAQQGKPVKYLYYANGEDATAFLGKYDVEPGAMEPETVPYYLLLVGSPERIPWRFQILLDGEYAVGRFWFDDPADAEQYVKRLLDAEQDTPIVAPDLDTFFLAPRDLDDATTISCHDDLMIPLLERLNPPIRTVALAANATRAEVETWLTARAAKKVPGLFFGACHGKESEEVGSLVLHHPDILASTDLGQGLKLNGTIFFIFACFSAGIPGTGDLLPREKDNLKLPPALTRLPQKLLAAGAGAYIGHVNRAWDYSYLGATREKPQILPFAEVWMLLASGAPVGHALDYLNLRALHYSNSLDDLRRRFDGLTSEEKKRFTEELWTWHDARYYVVLGDPMARLNITV